MQRIGPYTVLDELGRGGNGVVYSARDPAGRTVALKVLGRGRNPKKIQRFEREIEALAGFSHPHVVGVHTAGHTEQLVYFAMDLATGGSLADRLSKGGRFSPERAARLAIDLADGMAAAHARGVLHRDLKPDNVLFNDAGEVLISDFGLARQLRDSEDLTQSGHMLGSPGYMAPEQVIGDRSAQGERTDVYGLGATLYYALTGHAPFEGESLAYFVKATVEDRPEPPSAHNPLVPPVLDQIVLRCLEKAPADRQPSMGALSSELEGFLAGDVEAGRRGLLAGAVLAALLALGATAGLLRVWFRDAPPAPSQHAAVTPLPEPGPLPVLSGGAHKPELPPLRLGWKEARDRARAFMDGFEYDQAIRHFDHARKEAPEDVRVRIEKHHLEAYEKRMRLRWASGDVQGAPAGLRADPGGQRPGGGFGAGGHPASLRRA